MALFWLGIQPCPEVVEPTDSMKEGSEATPLIENEDDCALVFQGYLTSFIFHLEWGLK
jgi:hypothetical protein